MKFFYCSGWLNIRSFLRLVVPQRRSSSRSRHFFLPSLINTPIKFHWIENYFPKSIPQFQELSTETHILVSRISHQSQRHGEKTRKKKREEKKCIVCERIRWNKKSWMKCGSGIACTHFTIHRIRLRYERVKERDGTTKNVLEVVVKIFLYSFSFHWNYYGIIDMRRKNSNENLEFFFFW